jgi:flagellar biosynthesis/type III secretory pathway M-ring protein FliF/YscJ
MKIETENKILVCIVIALSCLIVGTLTFDITQKHYRTLAVQHNAAKWIVDDSGSVEFVWLKNK